MLLGSGKRHRDTSGLVAALDIGSSKVGCLIAAVEPWDDADADVEGSRRRPSRPPLQILGFAQSRSHGVEAGVVIDLPAAQQVVRAVVAEAEHMAETRLTAVHVAVNCGRPRSTTFVGHVTVADGIVRQRDIEALASGAVAFARRDGRVLLALDRIGHRLDGVAVPRPPLGLAGYRLEADHHAVSVDEGPLRNLSLLVDSCHLEIAGLVPAGLASALAVTTDDERRLGVTCIDIGAAVTSIAIFVEGHFLFTAQVPVGGQHLTLDIARALGIPLAEAERIKALYGTLVSSASDEHELVSYSSGPDDDARHTTTRATIGRIVRQRVEGLLSQVGERIAASTIGRLPVPRVVLCGGSGRLLGLNDFVARSTGQSVRVASPPLLGGLIDGQSGPMFACLAGVALAAAAVVAT